ncbi:hypothetical protein FACS1894159_11130 [Bacteroidia bacterium]|nr:hypothetical protein FACS1894159_11130 [Bacteroidia bacterium]
MILEILLLISVAAQLLAAIYALRLMAVTKYNVAWILFTVALCALALTRVGQYYQIVAGKEWRLPSDFFVWVGVVSSLCFAVGIFYVSKIFNYINNTSLQQKLTQKRILDTILRTEESERAHFSKELHDGLGPLLSSAKMSLSAMEARFADPREEEIMRNLSYMIDEAIRSLREISNNLSPHTLKDFGLYRAIDSYIRRSRSIGGVKIAFNSNLGAQRFDRNVEIILFRVVSELITNSLKHSGASQITLSLYELEGGIRLAYTDNGKGFDPEASTGTGMGLSNIHSRIGSIKGNVKIAGRPGHGMTADIALDLNEATRWK